MFAEEDLLPISALQHLAFCERQWGLIHLEQQWAENRLTAEGSVLHERVHETSFETRPSLVTARGVHLRSLELGLTGQADVVEFRLSDSGAHGTVTLAQQPGSWIPFPVEYKRGRPKADRSDKVQLCAQALCLEEMLSTNIRVGALFYGQSRRRLEVCFDRDLRSVTETICRRMHELYGAGRTPAAEYGKKCERCSLKGICQPRVTGRNSVEQYLKRVLRTGEPHE